jgi:hypothetical protein
MCECWQFGCGHTTKIECQSYRNRILVPASLADVNDDDPFIDNGTRNITPKERLTRSRSSSTPIRPPQFFLPTSTPSSVTSDNDATSSAASVHSSSSRGYGPGPAVPNTGSVNPYKLPVLPIHKISKCGGPEKNKKMESDQCYDCMLKNAKDNTTFQQNERDAETRLYDEINKRGSSAFGEDRQQVNTEEDGGVRLSPSHIRHAVDLGRGNPPKGPRRVSSPIHLGSYHPHLYQPPQQTQFYDPTAYHVAGSTQYNPYAAAAVYSQYTPHQSTATQYPPHMQHNPYAYPLDLYGAASPYQAYLYPQTEIHYQYQYQGENEAQGQAETGPNSQYAGYQYPGMGQMGYGYH